MLLFSWFRYHSWWIKDFQRRQHTLTRRCHSRLPANEIHFQSTIKMQQPRQLSQVPCWPPSWFSIDAPSTSFHQLFRWRVLPACITTNQQFRTSLCTSHIKCHTTKQRHFPAEFTPRQLAGHRLTRQTVINRILLFIWWLQLRFDCGSTAYQTSHWRNPLALFMLTYLFI